MLKNNKNHVCHLSVVDLSQICVKVEIAEGVCLTVDDGEGHSRHCAGSLTKLRTVLIEIFNI